MAPLRRVYFVRVTQNWQTADRRSKIERMNLVFCREEKKHSFFEIQKQRFFSSLQKNKFVCSFFGKFYIVQTFVRF